MSVTVYAYLLDLGRLRAAYDSQDALLLEHVEFHFRDELHALETSREVMVYDAATGGFVPEREEPHEPSTRQALHALVQGTVPRDGDGSAYAYALEMLCEYLGTPLPNEWLEGIRPGAIGVLSEVDRLRDLAEGWNPPVPIPYPSDLLGMTYIAADEAQTLLDRLPAITLTLPEKPDSPWDDAMVKRWQEETIPRMRTQYRAWLEEAVRTGMSIVAFLY